MYKRQQLKLYGNAAIVPQNCARGVKAAVGHGGQPRAQRSTLRVAWLIVLLAYLPCHALVLDETTADTSHIHSLCLVRRSWASVAVYLAPLVLYWRKKIWGLGWTKAFWDVSPEFPDDKSLPGHSPMFPVHLFCVQQPTSTAIDNSFTSGLRLQVSLVVGVLFPRRVLFR